VGLENIQLLVLDTITVNQAPVVATSRFSSVFVKLWQQHFLELLEVMLGFTKLNFCLVIVRSWIFVSQILLLPGCLFNGLCCQT